MNDQPQTSVLRRGLYYGLATVMIWLVFFALISVLPALDGMFSYGENFRMTVNRWFPWVVLSPVVFWFTWRYPIEWRRWRWRLLAHVAAAAVFVLASAWLSPFVVTGGRPFNRLDTRGDFENQPPPFEGSDRIQGGPFLPPQFDRNRMTEGPGWGRRGRRQPPIFMRAGFNLPIYLTMVSLCHAFFYFRRTQQRDRRALELETQLGQARLQSLRMQLQPHFLFNTLNAISTLVQTNPQAAQEMIANLGQMLRFSLDSAPDPEVPLEQELKFLDCYLEIAQMRFGDRLEVRFEVAPDTAEALVPTLILQPLVENAVRHGIEPGTARGTIEIGVRRAGETLFISIRDTGVGLGEEPTSVGTQNGIGIANTRARLESLYPGQHHFVVRNSAAGGCVAELEFPYHTEALAGAGETPVPAPESLPS
ncbi:MAG: sensor histidine kinase [Verrucomicrobiae bacterium]|nr:sensor histidine kinase [Verrucomicrobiae bacterium]